MTIDDDEIYGSEETLEATDIVTVQIEVVWWWKP